MKKHQDEAWIGTIMRACMYVCTWLLILFLLTCWSPEATVPQWLFTIGALISAVVGVWQGISKKGGY